MYYECLWIGTPFQKQEHHKCAEKLIYNPRKHRCDNIGEFEVQFANGVQTGEELLEFMRFRNCISQIAATSSHTDSVSYKSESEYYPQVAVLPNNEIKEIPNLILNDSPALRPREKMENPKSNLYV